MARILITGSSDGLGLAAAKKLVANGHSVGLCYPDPAHCWLADATKSSMRATLNALKTPNPHALALRRL
jgi:NAD(P)-dependent dehydrogenase (short-subunit alcohol dehydrogenase family)